VTSAPDATVVEIRVRWTMAIGAMAAATAMTGAVVAVMDAMDVTTAPIMMQALYRSLCLNPWAGQGLIGAVNAVVVGAMRPALIGHQTARHRA
jgi:hypothetical protein